MTALTKPLTIITNLFIIVFTAICTSFAPRPNWAVYFINPYSNDGKTGTIVLSEDANGHIDNKINLLILNNSQWILDDNEKLNIGSEETLKKLFTRQELSSEDPGENHESVMGAVSFSFGRLLCYKVTLEANNDKGSPYIEYLNIDSYLKRLLSINDIIDSTKAHSFKTFFQKYAAAHKKEIISRYKEAISAHADQLLSAEFEAFANPNYTYQKVILKQYTRPVLLSLKKNAIEVNIEVNDMNFSNGHIISSSVLLPYKALMPFLNNKSSCYNALLQLAGRH